MSGADIVVIDALTPTLRRLRAAATDLSRPMAEASEVMLEDSLENFQGEHDPLGIPWKKSAEAIAEGRKTLQKSGDLRNALERQSGTDFAAVGVYGTGGPAIYGRIHQWGGTIRPKVGKALNTPYGYRASVTMPRRSFLGFSDDAIMQIDRILVRHLLSAVNAGAPA
ncbi:MAG: phage virion morphogenesis protein [Sphingomonadales bacterium]|nr:phage virion morphogenesis protein [Sphingomonadales bacterium]